MAVEKRTELTFGEVEAALADMHGIAWGRRNKFQARLRKFLLFGIPDGVGSGRGRIAYYDAGAIVQLALAVELTQLGLEPRLLRKIIIEDDYGVLMAVLMASRALLTNPEGFDPREVKESDPLSMFLYLEATALAPLMDEEDDTDEEDDVSCFYGGIGVVQENIVRWTTGETTRLSLVNVTAVLWKLLNSLPERARPRFMERVNAWADDRLHGDDFDLQAWMNEAVGKGLFTARKPGKSKREQPFVTFERLAPTIRHLIEPEARENEPTPDGIIVLPGQREIYIDAKVPLEDFIEGDFEAVEKAVKAHIEWLKTNPYKTRFTDRCDYVLAYLPSESLFEKLAQSDPNVWEETFQHRILLATPSNLVQIIKTVELIWVQEEMALKAAQVIRAARTGTRERLSQLKLPGEEPVNGDGN